MQFVDRSENTMVTSSRMCRVAAYSLVLMLLACSVCLAYSAPFEPAPKDHLTSDLLLTVCAAGLLAVSAFRLVRLIIASAGKAGRKLVNTKSGNVAAACGALFAALGAWHLDILLSPRAYAESAAYEATPQHGGEL